MAAATNTDSVKFSQAIAILERTSVELVESVSFSLCKVVLNGCRTAKHLANRHERHTKYSYLIYGNIFKA